ncbi:hypothetical protein CANINC_004869 [Pichia inconspicua]|uniref:Cytochrome c oxidase subunit 4 n=1 Tax=Pichia inconspicua TaxID=52247 RepID=A0A4T0WW67_9ASCO|nr:hypothetical protein CANINC_004869 [[Candida] inconspicua]
MLRSGLSRVFARGITAKSYLGVVKNTPIHSIGAISLKFHNNLYGGLYFDKRGYSEVRDKNQIEVEEESDSEYYVDVSNIEKRWKLLDFDTQQDIISYLKVKQEFGWEYLTKDEKRAIYYIAYGKWGPRDPAVMSNAEFVFKLMTNMLLFSVLGFSLMNYAIDQEKIAELEVAAAAAAAADEASGNRS